METKKNIIPFLAKLKAILFGKSVIGRYEIYAPKKIRLMLHILNYIYIFGGWIFVVDYLDIYLEGFDNIIALLIIFFGYNFVIIYVATFEVSVKSNDNSRD